MKLIVGLGNPGIRYKLTRHNIGFLVVDALAEHLGIRLQDDKFKAKTGKGQAEGHDVILTEPQTFMNLSGEAVQPLMSYFKIAPEDILVIHDEIDIPFGQLRLQKNRGAGGHNGIKSIHDLIGSDYARLKVGVGRPTQPQMDVADFVLQNFSPEQEKVLPEFIGRSCEATLDFIVEGFVKAQGLHNQNTPQT
jgi:PTH1 family peptidyl-tRNA hydrolase